MRLFWTGFLMTGLLLIGLSTYERRGERVRRDTSSAPVAQSEDGTGFPYPYPTPKTQ
jgi:hypothetical protein